MPKWRACIGNWRVSHVGSHSDPPPDGDLIELADLWQHIMFCPEQPQVKIIQQKNLFNVQEVYQWKIHGPHIKTCVSTKKWTDLQKKDHTQTN